MIYDSFDRHPWGVRSGTNCSGTKPQGDQAASRPSRRETKPRETKEQVDQKNEEAKSLLAAP